MATADQLQTAADFYVDHSIQVVALVGIYQTDDDQWVNVNYRDRAEKEALETDVFGQVLTPDETVDDGWIEVHKRHFLN